MTEKCANCRNPLDPKGVSLDFCSPRCQEKWQEQGTEPLPGIAPIFPAPTPRDAPPVAQFKVEVAVEPVPQVPNAEGTRVGSSGRRSKTTCTVGPDRSAADGEARVSEDVEPQGSCEVCFRRDPRPGEGVVCWPCRQLVRDRLDEALDLWTNELPEEVLTGSGKVGLLAIDMMLPVPSIHSHRMRDGVTDGLVPDIRTEQRVVTVNVGGVERQVVTFERRLVRNDDGSPALVPAGDQTGEIPILVWLDQWVRYWRDQRSETVREQLPAPTMDRLAGWLRGRVDWAADCDPAFADFCAELAEQVGMLRRVTGMAPQPLPVPCPNPRCDMLTLVRWPYSKWDVCRNPKCGQMVGPRRVPGQREPRVGEYDDLVTEAVEALEMEQGGAA